MFNRLGILVTVLALLPLLPVQAELPEYTCFQEAGPWQPSIDLGADMAVVYGHTNNFEERVRQWREKGYTIGMMTGISVSYAHLTLPTEA